MIEFRLTYLFRINMKYYKNSISIFTADIHGNKLKKCQIKETEKYFAGYSLCGFVVSPFEDFDEQAGGRTESYIT